MAGRGRWLGVLTQWILVPAALGAAGYYLIAPQLSSIPPPIKPIDAAPAQPEVTTESAPQPTGRSFAPPEVEVSTTSGRRRSEDRPRRRKPAPKREEPKPVESVDAKPPTADPGTPPPADPGTSTTEPTLPPPVR
ncbi:MAG: hypothetical protein KIS66_09880 [Fimbriimonadaceae bacterium]|nr:hypothetical protein [Fimbriimonadaceae bacterium]